MHLGCANSYELTTKKFRGQYYACASNISAIKSGVIIQIKAQEPKAIFTYCYGHSLQLVVDDMIKEVQNFKDAVNTMSEISKLLKSYFHQREKLCLKK